MATSPWRTERRSRTFHSQGFTEDPALRTISLDFLLNLLANLKKLRIGHYLILTTQPLCMKLQAEHCEWSCAWTSMWHTHPGLPASSAVGTPTPDGGECDDVASVVLKREGYCLIALSSERGESAMKVGVG